MSDSHLHSGLEVDIVTVGGGSIAALSDIPDLLQWYDASQVVGHADNDRLTTIADSSGNGHTLTATSTGTQYKTAGISSVPSFFFGGNSGYTMGAGARVVPYTNFTLAWVMSYSGGRPWGLEHDGSGANGIGFYSGGFIVRNGGGSADIGPGPSGLCLMTYRLGSTGNLKGKSSRNIDALGLHNGLAAWGDAGQTFKLGSSGNNGSHFSGHIGEFASWNRHLTELEIGAVRDIMRAKYALWTI